MLFDPGDQSAFFAATRTRATPLTLQIVGNLGDALRAAIVEQQQAGAALDRDRLRLSRPDILGQQRFRRDFQVDANGPGRGGKLVGTEPPRAIPRHLAKYRIGPS